MAESADELLNEWYQFWVKSNTMPSKMPNSLHIRTLVYLETKKYVSVDPDMSADKPQRRPPNPLPKDWGSEVRYPPRHED